MLVEIEQEKIIRKKETVEVDIPEETTYYFLTGERHSYKMKPVFVEIDGEEKLYQYDIVKIGLSFECSIEKYFIRTRAIPNIMENRENKNHRLIKTLIKQTPEYLRTKEQFQRDLQIAITKIRA